jgi:hypothetical protein
MLVHESSLSVSQAKHERERHVMDAKTTTPTTTTLHRVFLIANVGQFSPVDLSICRKHSADLGLGDQKVGLVKLAAVPSRQKKSEKEGISPHTLPPASPVSPGLPPPTISAFPRDWSSPLCSGVVGRLLYSRLPPLSTSEPYHPNLHPNSVKHTGPAGFLDHQRPCWLP